MRVLQLTPKQKGSGIIKTRSGLISVDKKLTGVVLPPTGKFSNMSIGSGVKFFDEPNFKEPSSILPSEQKGKKKLPPKPLKFLL